MYKLKGEELEERKKKNKNNKKKNRTTETTLQRSKDVWLCTNEFKFLI